MVKQLNIKVPTLQDIFEVMGWIPRSRLGALLIQDRNRQRPYLMSGRPPKAAVSIKDAAKILKTSASIIRRILKIAREDGPDALRSAKWGKGCQ